MQSPGLTYYRAMIGSPPHSPSIASDVDTEFCIIGGGFAGLSAALRLAERGRSVRLLEANDLASGASGRNGGQVHVGMRRDQRWLEAALGPDDARHLWELALDARAHLDVLMADHDIECDYRAGYLHGDHKRRYVPHTRSSVDHLRERYGYDAIRFLDRDEVRALVGTSDYHGGSLDRRGGHLDPLKLSFGIANAAASAGAQLHSHTPVTNVTSKAGRWQVTTPHGIVSADKVLYACGGYLNRLDRQVDAHVMPINNYIAVTEILGAERARQIIQGGLAVSDSRFVVYYYRMTPDHRLLFGGGESYSYRFPTDIAGIVRRHLSSVFPTLRDISLDYAWGGTLSITPTRLPFVRELKPGLFNVSGFSGLGVVLAPYFGRILGDALAGDRLRFDRLARLPVPAFPGGRWLRWPTLVGAMSFFALRDRL